MSQFIDTINVKLKSSSKGLFLFFFKLVSGMILGLVVGLIGQEIFAYGTFLFSFVILVTSGLFYRKARHWGWPGLMVFDLFCVLIALLLRMYILVAPGA